MLKIPNEFAKNRLGTLEFMAPELFLAKPYKGEPVDVFAIGVTLFTMFATSYPFENVKAINGPY